MIDITSKTLFQYDLRGRLMSVQDEQGTRRMDSTYPITAQETPVRQGNVCTIGTFDLAHAGHVNLFEVCRNLATTMPNSRVIVGVNADGFVLRYKGELPILSLSERIALVASCRHVDAVDVNPQGIDGCKSIKEFFVKHAVSVLVVGSDWVCRDYAAQIGLTQTDIDELGLTIVFKPYHPGISTTDLRTRIAGRQDKLPETGSGTLVVVPSYNSNNMLRESLEGLEQYVVVDNGSIDCSVSARLHHVEANMYGPSYEAGALLHAFTRYEYDRYLLLQDSIVLREKRFVDHPADYYDGAEGVFALASIAPATYGMTGNNLHWVHDTFPQLDSVDLNQSVGIQYCAFSATRAQIEALVDAKFLVPERLPRHKVGSQSWERVFGAAFTQLDIPMHFLASCSTTDHPVFRKEFLNRG